MILISPCVALGVTFVCEGGHHHLFICSLFVQEFCMSIISKLSFLTIKYKTNVMGTLNMLGLAKRIGARFLLTSTSEVYGDPLEHPQKETYWGHVNPIGTQ